MQIFSLILRVALSFFFVVSFAVQKLLTLIKSHFLIFVFIFITLGGRSKKTLLGFMSKSVLPMFSSKSFIVSTLTFRSLIHFGFTFFSVHKWRSKRSVVVIHWSYMHSSDPYF